MESQAEENDLKNFLTSCRVCEKPDKYANIFYNINRELLNNLSSMVQDSITESDGLSKWICRDCVEKVEDFSKFKNKYLVTTNKVLSLLNDSEPSPTMKDEISYELESTIEILEEAIEPLLSPVEDNSELLQSDDLKQDINEQQEPCINDSKSIFSCESCSKTYQSQNSLNRHIRTVHENIRVSCPLCSSSFTQKVSLNEHIRNLHKESSKTFPCDFNNKCTRTFNTSKMLNQHLKCHTEERVKKPTRTVNKKKKLYRKQCSICGLFFKHVFEHRLAHQSKLFVSSEWNSF